MVGQLDQTIDMLQSPAPGGALRPFSPDKPPADPLDQFSPEVQYMIRFFAVECDADGQVQAVDQDFIASVTQQTAEEYTAAVLEKGKTRGFYQGYRYAVDRQADGITLLFLNAEREVHSLVTLLLTTGLIAAACLLAVLVLVTAFSRRAIAPYLRNLETQKQFITNAGHELKTPLTAIITSADVLSMEQADNEWVQGIRQQAGRMGKLITQLVALSRLDEENPFPDKAVFSLSDAVWETAEPFASMAAARGLTYAQEIADAVQIFGDRTAVQQMVSILLDNAVRYADEHGQIALSLCRRGRKAELIVSNTCRQAEEIDTARLFDRFYRRMSPTPAVSRARASGCRSPVRPQRRTAARFPPEGMGKTWSFGRAAGGGLRRCPRCPHRNHGFYTKPTSRSLPSTQCVCDVRLRRASARKLRHREEKP